MSTTLSAPPQLSSPVPRASYIPHISEDAYDALGCMEGVYDLPLVETKPAVAPVASPPVWQEYLLSFAVAGAAYGLHYLPMAPFRVPTDGGVRSAPPSLPSCWE